MRDPEAKAAVQAFVRALAPVPDGELGQFLEAVTLVPYEAGACFTRVGDEHDRVGFVLKGVFRVYYTSPEGAIHIRNFCIEGRPVGSYATILTGRPAHVTIEALEPSVVAQFSYAELARRFDRHPAWERVGRRVAEEHYIARERREHHLLALDAAARYEMFRQDFPGLEARITQANVASYVGVKAETLSRLRSRRGKS